MRHHLGGAEVFVSTKHVQVAQEPLQFLDDRFLQPKGRPSQDHELWLRLPHLSQRRVFRKKARRDCSSGYCFGGSKVKGTMSQPPSPIRQWA